MYIFLGWFSPTNVWNSQTLPYILYLIPANRTIHNVPLLQQSSDRPQQNYKRSSPSQSTALLQLKNSCSGNSYMFAIIIIQMATETPVLRPVYVWSPSSTSWLRNWPHNIASFLKVKDEIMYFVMIYLSKVVPLNSTIAAVGNGYIKSYKTKATVNVNMALTCTGKVSRVATSFMTC